jgi:prepilin-type N-terminal cleavage/methylation domain-containing protein
MSVYDQNGCFERKRIDMIRRDSRLSFSLVELLVVMAVIAILISLLSPAIQKTQENGRRLNCQNNLKQVGIGNHVHAGDFGDLAPGKIQRGAGGTGVYAVWTSNVDHDSNYDKFESHGILGYMGYVDPIAFYCPSWVDSDQYNWFFSYGSWGMIGGKKVGGWPEPNPVGKWSPPDLNYLWIQTQYHYRQGVNAGGGQLRSPSLNKDNPIEAIMADSFSSPTRGIQQHHQDGYNVLYIDGGAGYVFDEEHLVDNFHNGKAYHAGWGGFRKQEQVYLNHFSR